ncbi:MAG: hypothetical protein ABI324_02720 [Ktedonobacteraceae bacterium]
MKKSFYRKQFLHTASYWGCGLVLVLLLAACSGGEPGGATATPTPTPTPSPTPLPTLTPTSLPTLTMYKGNGYTIGYPKGWMVTTGTDGIVSFSDPNGIAYLAITSQPNPQGVISSSRLVDIGLQVFKSQVKNYQQANVASSTMVAGETWSQGSATGDITPEGQTSTVPAKVIVIADNHPTNSISTRGYTIAYGTGQQVFDLANGAYFQPILSSFRFV